MSQSNFFKQLLFCFEVFGLKSFQGQGLGPQKNSAPPDRSDKLWETYEHNPAWNLEAIKSWQMLPKKKAPPNSTISLVHPPSTLKIIVIDLILAIHVGGHTIETRSI